MMNKIVFLFQSLKIQNSALFGKHFDILLKKFARRHSCEYLRDTLLCLKECAILDEKIMFERKETLKNQYQINKCNCALDLHAKKKMTWVRS